MHLHLHTQQPDNITQSVSQPDQHGMLGNYSILYNFEHNSYNFPIPILQNNTQLQTFYPRSGNTSPSKNKNVRRNMQATLLRK